MADLFFRGGLLLHLNNLREAPELKSTRRRIFLEASIVLLIMMEIALTLIQLH